MLNCQIAISQTSLKQSVNLTPDNYRDEQFSTQDRIIPAAERINVYLPFLKNKKVGIFANHTSTVGNGHLVDTLQKLGVDIRVIFGPEHGFRALFLMELRSQIIKMKKQAYLSFHYTAPKEDQQLTI
jgi:uncharacterized protein YbbC (DUF1343 family)